MAEAREPPRRLGTPPSGVDIRTQELASENDRLRARVDELQREHRELLQRLSEVEEHNRALENLFVTSYRLHATLDPAEVLTTLDEILVNLLGAKCYGLWSMGPDGDPGELLLGSKDPDASGALTPEERTLARTTLTLGAWFPQPGVRPRPGVHAVAIVPLRVGSDAVGVLLVRKFLDHKPSLNKIDRRVLGLLADQAGTALLSARLHATQARPTS